MKKWLSAILFVFAIGFSQSSLAQSTEYAFKGDVKAFSVNGAIGNTYTWKLTHPDNSTETLASTSSSSGDITFSSSGTYVLWVQAADEFGCLTNPIIKTIIVTSEVTVTASIPNASETPGNPGQFTVDLGSVNTTGSGITVSYSISGTATSVTDYAALPLNIVVPNGSETAVIDVDGIVDDALVESNETVVITLTGTSLAVFPITTKAGLLTATVTIADNDSPVIPTVNSLITNNTTPVLTGTATFGSNETLTVTVNGVTYTSGDGNLTTSGTNWSLKIPAGNAISDGIYPVTATVTSESGLSSTDVTTNELTIDTTAPVPAPTVKALDTNDTTPILTGTAVVGAGEILTVAVNGITYTAGDGNLTLTGTDWSLQIPTGNEIPDGTYDVTATVTDAAGNATSDTTSGELIIDTVAPIVPTVVSQITNTHLPLITGTATIVSGEILKVTVNGKTYTMGDGKLLFKGILWNLKIPPGNEIPDGTYPVTATVTDAAGNSSSDVTNGELVVDTSPPAIPTVVSQVTNLHTPTITGTALLDQGDKLFVTVNDITYSIGDGSLQASGGTWTLQIPDLNKLNDGTYDVIASAVDLAGNTVNDTTSNELVVKTQSPVTTTRLATNDVNVTFRNMPVSGNVLTNDAGFIGSDARVNLYLEPVNGSVSIATDGSYTYTPKKDFTGTDNFYYNVCTSQNPAGCDTVNVTIQVINDLLSLVPPVANDDEVQTQLDSLVNGNVLANDFVPSGEALILNTKPKEGPTSGTVTLNEDGTFTYKPNAGFSGRDYFVYEVCGAVSGDCSEAKVTITVSSDSNYGHLFAADDTYFSLGKEVSGNLLSNDIYPSKQTLTVNTTPVVAPASGTVTINSDGTFDYVPGSDFVGTDQFVYQICDTLLNTCSEATAYVVVKEAPALYADLSIQKTGPETVGIGENVTYQISVTNLGADVANSLQINDYLPAAIQNPQFALAGSTTSSDWSGYFQLDSLDVNKTFTLTITGTVAANAPDTLKNMATVNSLSWDPVQANNISIVKTVVRRGPTAYIKGGEIQAVGSCNTSGKMLDASSSSGEGLSFSWSPSAYLSDASIANPVFIPGVTTRYHLTVTDNNGLQDTTSVLIVVANAPQAMTENNVFVNSPKETILLSGTQSTGAGLTYLWQSQDGIILNGETTATAQVSGLGMYYLQVTDSLGCTSIDSVDVGLYIQAISDTATTSVNQSVVINVVRNDIPQKSINPASISIVTPPQYGIAEVSADSLISYQPEQSYVGQDEFVYAICDYFQHCDQAKVLVLVNDLPFFIPEAFSPNGDGINDKFEIKGLHKYKSVEIVIFNRWGNIVYQSKNYGDGPGQDGFWDGVATKGVRIGSGAVPTGTYFYILKLNGKQNINGSFYLDR